MLQLRSHNYNKVVINSRKNTEEKTCNLGLFTHRVEMEEW